MPRLPQHRLLLLAAAAGLCALPLFASLPQSTHLWRLLHDTAHAPVFAALALVLLSLRAGPGFRRPAADFLHAFLLAVALGAGTELLQLLIGRDASWGDLGRDAGGALAGLGLAAWIGRGRGGEGRWRLVWAAAALAAAVAIAAPVLWALAAYRERDRQWPVLADFDSRLDLFFLSGAVYARHERIEWQGGPALRVALGTGPYPGVGIDEPVPDWRAYGTLVIELDNPGGDPLSLTIRVHDRWHDQSYDDRWNQAFTLAPGAHRFEFPLSSIARAPRGRRLDLAAVDGVVLFANAEAAGRSFIVRRILLAGAGAPGARPAAGTGPDFAAVATLRQ